MKIIGTLLFLFLYLLLNAQSDKKYILRMEIKDMPNQAIYLYQQYGDNNIILDTTFVTSDKKAAFLLDDTYHIGTYRVLVGDNKYMDVIFNKENIDIKTDYNYLLDSAKIVASIENRLLFEYYKVNQLYERKAEYLIPLIRFYPERDDFYYVAEKEFNKVQQQKEDFILNVQKNNKNLFVAKYLRIQRTPLIDTKLSDREKVIHLTSHFFDYVDFNDTSLFYSNVLTSKVIDFLKLFRDESLSRHDEEKQFIKGIDILMQTLKKDDAAYEFVIEYLIKGFEKFKYDEVLEHIASKYQTKTACENEERKSELQKALDFYKKTAVGATAPDIELNDKNGFSQKLSQLKKDTKVVIFWQTTCPHCLEILPEFNKYYQGVKDRHYDVYAVSIDTNVEEWKTVIAEGGYSWTNVNENKGWNNKILDDYNIFATPTILVLDKDRKIIAKPVDFKSLKEALEKIKN